MTHQTITKDGQEYYLVPVNKKPFIIEKTFKFEIMAEDLPNTMTWNDANSYIKKHYPDWRMPTREELLLIYEQKEEIGGFKTKSSGGSDVFPDWYWSSTQVREYPGYVWITRFSDGYEDWSHKDNDRLSCRPVRLVPVSGCRAVPSRSSPTCPPKPEGRRRKRQRRR